MHAQLTSRGTVHVVGSSGPPHGGMTSAIAAVGLPVVRHDCIDDFLFNELCEPGCIVVEVSLARGGRFDASDLFSEIGAVMPVIVVADYDDVPTSVQIMKAGAVDYLVSPVAADRLLGALLRAIHIDEMRHRRHAAGRELLDLYLKLADDEKTILAAVVDGRLNKQLAGVFSCCERTVKKRRSRMMRKFGATSIVELVRIWRQLQGALNDSPSLRNFDSAAPVAATD